MEIYYVSFMSILSSSKYTIGGTLTEVPSSTFGADIRLYDNESTYVGENVAQSNNFGVRNTVIGYQAMFGSSTGGNNVALGYKVSPKTNGFNNVVLGSSAAAEMDRANDNVVIGQGALSKVATCTGNISIGAQTGNGIRTGSLNTLIGHRCMATDEGDEGDILKNTFVGSLIRGNGASNVCVGVSNQIFGTNNRVFGVNNIVAHGTRNTTVIGYGNNVVEGGNDCILIGNGLTNTQPDGINIANRILCGLDDRSKSFLNLESDRILIRASSANILELDEYNVHVSARSLFNVRCDASFENNVAFKDVVDVYKLKVSSVATFSSNIELHDGGNKKQHWKIGLVNKRDLAFVSANNTNFTITDDFEPEILNFTGKHRCKLSPDSDFDETRLQKGMVVVATGRYCNLSDDDVIEIDESIPVVDASRAPFDQRAFGVVCAVESRDSDQRSFCLGNIRFNVFKKSNRVIVNSLGEGAILVCNENGSIRNGDYLTTSSKPGIAMRQKERICYNYTVAKATCDCNFDCMMENVLIGCTYKF